MVFPLDEPLVPGVILGNNFESSTLPLSSEIIVGSDETLTAVFEEVIVNSTDSAANPLETKTVSSALDFEPTADNNGNHTQENKKRTNTPFDKTPPKKRQIFQAKWKASMARLAYNSGKAHVSLRGKERPARSMKPGCTASCKKNCQGKVTPEQRQIHFQKYWNTQNKVLQWLFLAKLVTVSDVKRRRVDVEDDETPFRKHSYEYHLLDENDRPVPVCQTMFLHTFDISIKVVRSALVKNSPDKRGKHENRRKLALELIDSVKAHIKSFPLVESHYCRVNTRKKYLDENLSVAKMHRLYLFNHVESHPHTATLRQYRDIFNTYFNLSFFKPKKDQCFQCSEWKAFTEQEKLAHPEKLAAYDEHVKNKQLVRDLKWLDKVKSRDREANAVAGSPVMRVITFDLQKVFLCPKSDVGEFFYKSKLSCYNFTVFDCTVKEAHCYCWDQTIGDRGANEMSSCVYRYITELVKKGVNEIHIYSDSCSAQNKNQFLFSMYFWLSRKLKIKIIHRYLEKGHTQMEADSVHARIEKNIRNQDIYLPKQWYGLIKTARVKKPHYFVTEVSQNDILNMKELSERFQWSKVTISKIREIVFDCSSTGSIAFKCQLENESTIVNILNKRPGRPINWSTLGEPKPLYSRRRPLKPKLLKDLRWFVSKNYIPMAYVDCFKALLAQPEEEDELEDDNAEDDIPQEITPADNALAALYEQDESNMDPVAEDENMGQNNDKPINEDDDASTDSDIYD